MNRGGEGGLGLGFLTPPHLPDLTLTRHTLGPSWRVVPGFFVCDLAKDHCRED